ncbi:MAG TPA: signal peptidase II [Longimicrobiales bacterium]
MDAVSAREAGSAVRPWTGSKAAWFVMVVGSVLAVDVVTKLAIQQSLHLYEQVPIIGDYIRLTYIYNPGAAFGIQLGPHSRLVFMVLSVVALVLLGGMYWNTPIHDRVRLTAISLVCGGAVGNLVDRIRSPHGVVDFLDVGVGDVRWPVFNIADIAVTTGAIFLALSLWREERQDERAGI